MTSSTFPNSRNSTGIYGKLQTIALIESSLRIVGSIKISASSKEPPSEVANLTIRSVRKWRTSATSSYI